MSDMHEDLPDFPENFIELSEDEIAQLADEIPNGTVIGTVINGDEQDER